MTQLYTDTQTANVGRLPNRQATQALVDMLRQQAHSVSADGYVLSRDAMRAAAKTIERMQARIDELERSNKALRFNAQASDFYLSTYLELNAMTEQERNA